MKIVLATNNKGKIKELKQMLSDHDVCGFGEILGDLDIEENGETFAQNAIIKAKTIYDILKNTHKNLIVISDDSGLCVKYLDNKPNIFSARYAGENATDEQNRQKLIEELSKIGKSSSPAHYIASICVYMNDNFFVTHGWCHGDVICENRGTNGFGYDPLFIPDGYDQTFGELDESLKKTLSHRAKALKLSMIFLKSKLKN